MGPVGKNGNRRISRRKPYELDSQGLVPLPAKVCFTCRKSCKNAPLVACDYCPLLYHLDCLDPPLCALPAGLWMCNNHPEQFIDWNLVSSASATQRLKLWNEYGGPIDQDTVKIEFFRKIHSQNPPFRVKRSLPPRDRAVIPPMVEYHYQNPPQLLPSIKDVDRWEQAYKRYGVNFVSNENKIQEDAVVKSYTDPDVVRQVMEEMVLAFEEADRKMKEFCRDVEGVKEEDEEENATEEKEQKVDLADIESQIVPTEEATMDPKTEDQNDKPTKRRRRGKAKKIDEPIEEPEVKKKCIYLCGTSAEEESALSE